MRVSIVIPLYQKGPYIRRALESIGAQTLEAHEVVVVDDGSTDGGDETVRACGDTRVRLVRQTHAGVSAARNRGIALARASWVAFLDADDEWRPTFLEAALAAATSCPDSVAGFTNLIDATKRRPLLGTVRCKDGVVRDYFATLLENKGQGMSSSSVVVRTSVLTACGGFPLGVRHGQDVDTWARLAWSGGVGYCPEPLAVYHSEVPNSATQRARSSMPAFPSILVSYREWAEAKRIPQHLRRSSRMYTNRALALYAIELAHAGRSVEARLALREHWDGHARSALRLKAYLWTLLPARWLRSARVARQQLFSRPV